MLIFSLDEMPNLSRGRGVILQRYRNGQLNDIQVFNSSEGLTWRKGKGRRNESNLNNWDGKRGQSGRLAPKGFPRSNKFN